MNCYYEISKVTKDHMSIEEQKSLTKEEFHSESSFTDRNPAFEEWNKKWLSYVTEELEGANRLKYSILFPDEVQKYLKALYFNQTYWFDLDWKKFNVQLNHSDFPVTRMMFEGEMGTKNMDLYNYPNFISPTEVNHIITFLLNFDLEKMISYGHLLPST